MFLFFLHFLEEILNDLSKLRNQIIFSVLPHPSRNVLVPTDETRYQEFFLSCWVSYCPAFYISLKYEKEFYIYTSDAIIDPTGIACGSLFTNKFIFSSLSRAILISLLLCEYATQSSMKSCLTGLNALYRLRYRKILSILLVFYSMQKPGQPWNPTVQFCRDLV